MIVVERLHVRAGSFSLDGIDFTVPAGQYGVLMGRTGSGKTTILETICGLRPLHAGRVLLDSRDVTGLRPAERNIGYVPQDGALFPSMSVFEQIGFALRIRGWAQEAIRERVEETADMVGLSHLLDRKPQGLSGGETQRVALGRALAFRPQNLCLDEPLSSLDDDSRQELIALLKRIQKETGVTALHITHNGDEAERLADRWLTLADGRIHEDARSDATRSAAPSSGDPSGA